MKRILTGALTVVAIVGICGLAMAQSWSGAANETAALPAPEPGGPAPAATEPAVANETAAAAAEPEPSPDTAVPASVASAPEPPSAPAVAPQWVWGEVASVDTANRVIQIKHLDYDTYEEVLKNIQISDDTLFENVNGINELKAGDSVTVDFKMKDGAQVAELVVVDKNAQAAVEPSADVTQALPAAPEPAANETDAPAEVKETPTTADSPASAENQTAAQPPVENQTVLPSGNVNP